MITCVVEYVVDSAKLEAFEEFAQRWIALVNEHGADKLRDDTGCVLRYDRSFMRPVLG
jgi:hypothetical protein